jgi:hypothetical protein
VVFFSFGRALAQTRPENRGSVGRGLSQKGAHLMASVTGRKGRTIWQMEFKGPHGVVRKGVSSGMRDRRAAEGMASMIERDAERIRAGLEPKNADLTGPYLGLTTAEDRRRPLTELIDAYRDELLRRGSPSGATAAPRATRRPRWCVRPETTKNGRAAELPRLPD